MLAAAGRAPVTDGLGLDVSGVRTGEGGFVTVDKFLRATAERTWAAGDVAGIPRFTHASPDDYRVIRSQLVGTTGHGAGAMSMPACRPPGAQ
ncbi:FAD-dependent oxidoreductase [Micromonospora sp. NPDC049240]|uniref:FAD-dependent oxidoreductase n=1 Tax=Micromonospora sp. NPDC049240 TaxID=3155151 RepID=UPI0034003B59